MRDYSLGFRTVGFYARPQLVHPTLKRIERKAAKSESLKHDRELKAIQDGRVKTCLVNGLPRVMERRERVGKYFSAKGGYIEPSNVTKIRNTRLKSVEAQPNDGKTMQIVKAALVKDVPKRTKVSNSTGYIIRVDGVAHQIKVRQMPQYAH